VCWRKYKTHKKKKKNTVPSQLHFFPLLSFVSGYKQGVFSNLQGVGCCFLKRWFSRAIHTVRGTAGLGLKTIKEE
jgi:hypothetical protein